ncbi:MAG TPA: DUF4403 family protein, partial [Taishania sp.]|nr:DUF4403 family protein [Taishania sp.]
MKRKYVLWFFFFVLLAIVGRIIYKRFDRIIFHKNTSTTIYEPEISHLNFPVFIALDDLELLANQKISDVLIDHVVPMENQKDSMAIKVTRLGDVKLSLREEHIHVALPLKVEIVVLKKIGQATMKLFEKNPISFEIDIEVRSPIELLENYKLGFKSQFKSIVWKKEPVIKIMGIPFNIKEKVENKLNEKLPDISQQLDQELKHKINLKKAINRIWDRMQYNKPLKRGEKEGFVTKI